MNEYTPSNITKPSPETSPLCKIRDGFTNMILQQDDEMPDTMPVLGNSVDSDKFNIAHTKYLHKYKTWEVALEPKKINDSAFC